jgi:hypothetical protein
MNSWRGILYFLISQAMSRGIMKPIVKRFIIRFSHRDETLKLSLQLDPHASPVDFLSELKVQIRNEDPFLEINRLEFYDPELSSFHQVEGEDLTRILNNNFIQILVFETPTQQEILQIEGRAFDLPDGLYIANILLPIQELHIGREQGTGLNTWDGAVVLAKYLETKNGQELISKKCVLEVGAGTGTAGLASLYLGSTMVTLTDLPYTLDNLRDNTRRALESLGSSASSLEAPLCTQDREGNATAHVLPLDWSDPSTYFTPSSISPSYPSQWDVILGLLPLTSSLSPAGGRC